MVQFCFRRCSAFKSLVREANEEEEKARDAKMEKAEREEQAKKKAAAEAEAAAAAATAEKEKEAAAAAAAAKLSAMKLAEKESTGIDKVCFFVCKFQQDGHPRSSTVAST